MPYNVCSNLLHRTSYSNILENYFANDTSAPKEVRTVGSWRSRVSLAAIGNQNFMMLILEQKDTDCPRFCSFEVLSASNLLGSSGQNRKLPVRLSEEFEIAGQRSLPKPPTR